LRRLVQHLNWLYTHEPAFYELDDSSEGFEWIDFDSDNRSGPLCARAATRRSSSPSCHAGCRGGYRLGVNAPGFYEEILNTDAETCGGSNVGNWGGRLPNIGVAGQALFHPGRSPATRRPVKLKE
jgi:1,4-alpha-glucan branching enzyme